MYYLPPIFYSHSYTQTHIQDLITAANLPEFKTKARKDCSPYDRLDEVHNEVGRPLRVHMYIRQQCDQATVDDVIVKLKKSQFAALANLFVGFHQKLFSGVGNAMEKFGHWP